MFLFHKVSGRKSPVHTAYSLLFVLAWRETAPCGLTPSILRVEEVSIIWEVTIFRSNCNVSNFGSQSRGCFPSQKALSSQHVQVSLTESWQQGAAGPSQPVDFKLGHYEQVLEATGYIWEPAACQDKHGLWSPEAGRAQCLNLISLEDKKRRISFYLTIYNSDNLLNLSSEVCWTVAK